MCDAARWELIVVSFGCWRISFFPTRAFVVSFVCVMDWPGYFGTETSPRGREMVLWLTARADQWVPALPSGSRGKDGNQVLSGIWGENEMFLFLYPFFKFVIHLFFYVFLIILYLSDCYLIVYCNFLIFTCTHVYKYTYIGDCKYCFIWFYSMIR